MPSKAKLSQTPPRQMSAEEERAMLEKQYYALMVHAEKMYYRLKGEWLD